MLELAPKFNIVKIILKGCTCDSSGNNNFPMNSDEEYLMYESCENIEVKIERLIEYQRTRPWFTNEQWQHLTDDVLESLK